MHQRWHDSRVGRVPYYSNKPDNLIALEAEIEELLTARGELQSELRALTGELIDKQLEAARIRHQVKGELP